MYRAVTNSPDKRGLVQPSSSQAVNRSAPSPGRCVCLLERPDAPWRESRTIAAVLGPTPLNFISQARASSNGNSFRNSRSSEPRSAVISRQHLLNARSLLVGEVGAPDGSHHRNRIRLADRLPGLEVLAKRLEGPVAVGIVGILREDGGDEFIHWRQRVSPNRLSIKIQQPAMDFDGKQGRFHQ